SAGERAARATRHQTETFFKHCFVGTGIQIRRSGSTVWFPPPLHEPLAVGDPGSLVTPHLPGRRFEGWLVRPSFLTQSQ
ncbi:MAG: hypothetical protein Q8O63_12965, partial [Hoeflea sp.]|nr:hypothetical protein [Hoeflea sp.]